MAAKAPVPGKRPVGRPRKNPRSKEEEEEFRLKQKKLLAQKLAKWDALKQLSSDDDMDEEDFMDDDEDEDSDASLIEMLKQSKAELSTSAAKYRPVGRPKSTAAAVKSQGCMCKPPMQTKSISCTPIRIHKNPQTEFGNPDEKKIFVPVAFPVLTPTPLIFNTAPVPHPISLPVPLPIPLNVPLSHNMLQKLIAQLKEYRESLPEEGEGTEEEKKANSERLSNILLNIQQEDIAGKEGSADAQEDAGAMEVEESEGMKVVKEVLDELLDSVEAAAKKQQLTPQQQLQQQLSQQQQQYMKQQQLKESDNKQSKAEKSKVRQDLPLAAEECSLRIAEMDDSKLKIKYSIAVKAFRCYASSRNEVCARKVNLELLNLPAEELAYHLCQLIEGFQRPNGEPFHVDTLHYLAIGIQYYLFLNGRNDNIFYDKPYECFFELLSNKLIPFTIRLNPQSLILCRVTEEQLWEANVLGSHSPWSLLNTLIYMNTKNFLLLEAHQHLLLSFSNVMKQWKKNAVSMDGKPARTVYLKYNPISTLHAAPDKRQKVDNSLPYEQLENVDNPLRCPVKLYEFYLSKCPESIKNRNDLFYLQPEPSCLPESPVWFSVTPLSKQQLALSIARVKAVREVQESILNLRASYLANTQLNLQQQVTDGEGNKYFVDRPFK